MTATVAEKPKAEPRRPKRFRFRLKLGPYIMADPSGAKTTDGTNRPQDVTFYPPAIIETDINLETRFGSQKFERIHDDDASVPGRFVYDPSRETIDEFIARVRARTEAGESLDEPSSQEGGQDETTQLLETMTVKELQGMAEDNEIDLKGARSKDDVIKAIKASGVKVV